jgi:hypothetical protein
MNRARWLLPLILFAVTLPTMSGHSQDKPNPIVEGIMKRKLQYSQKLLEGIAINDFEMINDNAVGLITISKQAEWMVLKTPAYELNSNDFRRAVSNVIDKAKEKNIDGVALAYVEVTLSCVRCHKHVREVKMGMLEEPLLRKPVLALNED